MINQQIDLIIFCKSLIITNYAISQRDYFCSHVTNSHKDLRNKRKNTFKLSLYGCFKFYRNSSNLVGLWTNYDKVIS